MKFSNLGDAILKQFCYGRIHFPPMGILHYTANHSYVNRFDYQLNANRSTISSSEVLHFAVSSVEPIPALTSALHSYTLVLKWHRFAEFRQDNDCILCLPCLFQSVPDAAESNPCPWNPWFEKQRLWHRMIKYRMAARSLFAPSNIGIFVFSSIPPHGLK